jgi:uncharacterized protein (DUF2267 family)
MTNDDTFCALVARRLHAAPATGRRAAQVVVTLLGERLSAEAREALAVCLPGGYAERARGARGRPRPMTARDFTRAVVDRGGAEAAGAQSAIAAVFATLREIMPVDAFDELIDHLPPDFLTFLDPGLVEASPLRQTG